METLTESQVDYLRTVLELTKEQETVRAVDIARRLQYSKPSVHRAIESLVTRGFLIVGNSKCLALTEDGRRAAEDSYQKISFFADLLSGAGLTEARAREEAIKLSHSTDKETFDILKRLCTR
ncbi:MAG: MarR family transcriptional regulator [Lachnospiraceae bacterium]|nr:MarR family transcriptional regulator [Lachnospiraceae bacterium]